MCGEGIINFAIPNLLKFIVLNCGNEKLIIPAPARPGPELPYSRSWQRWCSLWLRPDTGPTLPYP